mgnify:CR=1 FL=1
MLLSDLTGTREWWEWLNEVYSLVLQTVVGRLYDNLRGLTKLEKNGYGVGQLKWKPVREYRSFKYSHSGFKLDKKRGQ